MCVSDQQLKYTHRRISLENEPPACALRYPLDFLNAPYKAVALLVIHYFFLVNWEFYTLVFHWEAKKLYAMTKTTKPQNSFMSYGNNEKIKI